MFLIKTINIIIFLCIFTCSTVFAQTTTSTTGKFTFLNKGEEAPFTGTLFDPVATAKILADKEKSKQECDLRVGYETDKQKAKCIRDTELLEAELEIEKKKYNLIVSAQDEEIRRLQDIAVNSNNYDILWFSGGAVIGIVASIAIFFAAAEIAK